MPKRHHHIMSYQKMKGIMLCLLIDSVVLEETIGSGKLLYGVPHDKSLRPLKEKLEYSGLWILYNFNLKTSEVDLKSPLVLSARDSRPPNQDEEADEIFYKQLGEISQLLALVLMGEFNLPDVCWKCNIADKKQSRRFLEGVEDNFLTQLVSEPTREGAPLDLLFANREGLVGDVMIGGHLGHRDHEMIEFLILGEVKRVASRNATSDFWRADFGLLRRLVGRVPWEAVLKGKGVQEGWTLVQKEILKAQEQAVPMCQKTSWQGRRLAWLNRAALAGTQDKKESLWPLEEGTGNSGGLQRCCEVTQPPELEDRDGEQNEAPIIQGEMVSDLLHHLDTHKSMGLDGIHPRVLRELAEVLPKPLSIIYQQSWLTGEVPVDWRLANAMPIHKKGWKEGPENYKPVSLTLVLGKVMEHILLCAIA
ncbi:hypothetical protein GRJ2_002843400 [Grus japonensis]|uniref:Rna-directed dna polymerase from mobile element jockey-like n=1 Tax=Grus japonensis TaxID=30415 RepID=A0ABC9Y173_GRUJA